MMEAEVNISKKNQDNSGSTVTSQILEYFNSHSQSENLSRYLQGSSLKTTNSFENIKATKFPYQSTKDENQQIQSFEKNKKEYENAEISPTSSIISNRKLEWDNGADIGYTNVQIIQKSVSLPVLNTLGQINLHKQLLESPQKTRIAQQPSSQFKIFSKINSRLKNISDNSNSSVSQTEGQDKIISSSSISSDCSKAANVNDCSSSLDDNLPIAESTGFNQDISTSESDPQVMSKKVKNFKRRTLKGKFLKLEIANPIYVDCVTERKNILLRDENVQTDFIETDIHRFLKLNDHVMVNSLKSTPIQVDVPSSVPDCNFQSENTKKSDLDISSNKENTKSESQFEDQKNNEVRAQDLLHIANNNKIHERIKLLGSVFSTETKEISKGIELIKKIVKSKKNNNSAKRKYINKIIKKMIERDYSDESSENVSELKLDLNETDNITPTPFIATSSECSELSPKNSTNSSNEPNNQIYKKTLLYRNKPWIPILKNSNINCETKPILGYQTFSHEIVTPVTQLHNFSTNSEAVFEEQCTMPPQSTLKKSHYTIVGNDNRYSEQIDGKGDDNLNFNYLDSNQHYRPQDFNSIEHWRDEINKDDVPELCNNVTFIQFAKNEKMHQLKWIKHEIVHLNKLKKLLENANGSLQEQISDDNQNDISSTDSHKPNEISTNQSLHKQIEDDNLNKISPTDSHKKNELKDNDQFKKDSVKIPQIREEMETKITSAKQTMTVYLLLTENIKYSELSTKETSNNVYDNILKHLDGTLNSNPSSQQIVCKKEEEMQFFETLSKVLPFPTKTAELISTTAYNVEDTSYGKITIRKYIFEAPETSNMPAGKSTTGTNLNRKNENIYLIGKSSDNIIYRREQQENNFGTNNDLSTDTNETNANKKCHKINYNMNKPKPTDESNNSKQHETKSDYPKQQSPSDLHEKIINLQNEIELKEKELKDIRILLSLKKREIFADKKKESVDSFSVLRKYSYDKFEGKKFEDERIGKNQRKSSSSEIETNKKLSQNKCKSYIQSIINVKNDFDIETHSHTDLSEDLSDKELKDFNKQQLKFKISTNSDTFKSASKNKPNKRQENELHQHQELHHNVDENVIFEMKETIEALKKLLEEEQRSEKHTSSHRNSSITCCSQCNLPLLSTKERKPVAYTLILEEDELRNATHNRKTSKQRRKRRPLDEIIIKIPYKYNNKKKTKKNGYIFPEMKDSSDTEKHKSRNFIQSNTDKGTLQDYLAKNKPQFVKSAEERRKLINKLAAKREHYQEKYGEILTLAEHILLGSSLNKEDCKPKRLFSSSEMKRMSFKIYKQLPEVQQKIKDKKKEELKCSNRILLNIFTKKLKDRVLKGEPNIPLRATVI